MRGGSAAHGRAQQRREIREKEQEQIKHWFGLVNMLLLHKNSTYLNSHKYTNSLVGSSYMVASSQKAQKKNKNPQNALHVG